MIIIILSYVAWGILEKRLYFGKEEIYLKAYLASKTLCMGAVTMRGSQRFYDTKNLYGWSESRATQKALHDVTAKRGAVISRWPFTSKTLSESLN